MSAIAAGDLGALLQLSSAALPVGAYSYSQGLESAIEHGLVHDAISAGSWIADNLSLVMGRYEAPLWWRLRCAWDAGDREGFAQWNDSFVASRETRESRAETLQMGYSLRQLLRGLGDVGEPEVAELSYPAAHAQASAAWRIAPASALYGYLYGWAENQVMAALKSVPLGQVAGQRLLMTLRPVLGEVARSAIQLRDDELATQTPMLAILGSRHETQYSRLFRS